MKPRHGAMAHVGFKTELRGSAFWSIITFPALEGDTVAGTVE